MGKILHSLRFQLLAVVVGVFLGILFLLMLFFHEVNVILIRTEQVAQSAETNDFVAKWISGLSPTARERTKLMSLGKAGYLSSLQASLNEITDLYQQKVEAGLQVGAKSGRELIVLYRKHMEYMELLDGFAKDQVARRQAWQAAVARAERHNARAREAALKATQAAEAAAKRANRRSKRAGRKVAPKVFRPSLVNVPARPAKEIDLDDATNETFKAYENELREGLFLVQETIRAERRDKLMGLNQSVGRAKDRLIYSLLLLLAMVAYLAVVLKWKILDPMKELERGALVVGRGALGHQVQVNVHNEIGELAEVFNRMSVQLEQTRSAEVRLRRLEAIEQVVRSVNHEINNPLMIISANAEYLLAVLGDKDPATSSKLSTVLEEVRRIFTVTQRLKEIKEPVTESYIGDKDQMIDILRSSRIQERP